MFSYFRVSDFFQGQNWNFYFVLGFLQEVRGQAVAVDVLADQVVALMGLLEKDDVNHQLVCDQSNYHTFAKQKLLDRLSTIYVEFYYRMEY